MQSEVNLLEVEYTWNIHEIPYNPDAQYHKRSTSPLNKETATIEIEIKDMSAHSKNFPSIFSRPPEARNP